MIEKLDVKKILDKPLNYMLDRKKVKCGKHTFHVIDINYTRKELVLIDTNYGSLSTKDIETELITSTYTYPLEYFKENIMDKFYSGLSYDEKMAIEKW